MCTSCGGRRYRSETLDIRYGGLDIAGVLELTVEEAHEFFLAVPEISRPLEILEEVGLGYLLLGQPAVTFSGGEAQRVKLAAELGRPQRHHTLYLLDEPTSGLHMRDVALPLGLVQRLVDAHNTVLVVEHHIPFIAAADYVLDLGPGGGPAGGRMVAAGSPAEVASVDSATGRRLRLYLDALGER